MARKYKGQIKKKLRPDSEFSEKKISKTFTISRINLTKLKELSRNGFNMSRVVNRLLDKYVTTAQSIHEIFD